jgi:hypothetical protein
MDEVKCELCGKGFDNYETLIAHLYGHIEELRADRKCQFCLEPLEDGDVCYKCYETGRQYAYDEGHSAGFKEGFEEGKQQGRDAVLSEIERDPYIPWETRHRIRWRY